jgi:hypothetical protein
MQGDGNLVLYDSKNKPLWHSNTDLKGAKPYRLVMQKDRNLVLYDGYNKPLWSSRTVV